MSDYIKRGEAFYAVSEEAGMLKKVVFDRIMKRLESIPSADVEPVRHGRYKSYENSYGWRCICSVCGCDFKAPMFGTVNYCPNCGARMDGEEE